MAGRGTVPAASVLRELRRIPGVGPRIALDLWNIGIRGVAELAGREPEELYARICHHQGVQVDRCMLYVMRCAVYYAATPEPEPRLLKWWAWKDER
jgi:hypothetical protein